MQQRSWFFENSFFYTLLAIVLLIHLIFLFLRFIQDKRLVSVNSSVLNVHVLARSADLKNQIVRSEDPQSETPSKKRFFLSDKNRTFSRESLKRLSLNELGAFNNHYHPFKNFRGVQSTVTNRSEAHGSTSEFVEKIPLGDHTYLNTVEYKYYGFFQRMRERLEHVWGMSLREKAQRLLLQGRSISSIENLLTSIDVVLNPKGELVHVVIKGSSGVLELDEAALDSFNRAGPFSNPPKELLKNGFLNVSWGFLVNPT